MSDKRKIGTNKDEVPEFEPIRQELIEQVKYWAEEALQYEYGSFVNNNYGGSPMYWAAIANHRINRIAATLGDDEVTKAFDEVYAEFGKKQDKRYWDVYLNGSKEQREALQDEIQREFDERESK